MTEYIERGTLIGAIEATEFLTMQDAATAMQLVTECPAADVEPVAHARWEECDLFDWKYFKCTNCGETISGFPMYPYCHICGAHMDERSEGK